MKLIARTQAEYQEGTLLVAFLKTADLRRYAVVLFFCIGRGILSIFRTWE